jgi:hypothetical protein
LTSTQNFPFSVETAGRGLEEKEYHYKKRLELEEFITKLPTNDDWSRKPARKKDRNGSGLKKR